jgi:hypothetical protein
MSVLARKGIRAHAFFKNTNPFPVTTDFFVNILVEEYLKPLHNIQYSTYMPYG